MYQYIVKRLLLMIPTLFGAALLVFFLLRLLPGDVCEVRLAGTGMYVDDEMINQCRDELGLNDPLSKQFMDFVGGYFTGDLGTSMWTGQPILHEIGIRFQLSLQLAIMATLVAIAIAIPLGVISAVKPESVRRGLDAADQLRFTFRGSVG
jgi:peptide/nickel transport system permease protein